MKNGRISIDLDKKDASKFEEISKKTKWTDKFIVTISLREFHKEFKKDWKKRVIQALEEEQ